MRNRMSGTLEKDVPSPKPVKDTVVQTRVDSRYLAVVAEYFSKQGHIELTMAALVRMSLENFAEILVHNNLAKWVGTYEEARDYLSQLKFNLNTSGTSKYNVAIALHRDRFTTAGAPGTDLKTETAIGVREYCKTLGLSEEETERRVQQMLNNFPDLDTRENKEYISDPSDPNALANWEDRPAPKIDIQALTGAPRTIARPAEPLKYDMKTAELRNKRQQELEKNQLEQSSKKGDQEDDQV